MVKTEKTVGVKVSGIEYIVPAKYVTALRRKFDGKRVAEKGLSIDDARTAFRLLCCGENGVQVRFARNVPWEYRQSHCYRWGFVGMYLVEDDHRHATEIDTWRPESHAARLVADTLADRLVRKWARDGILERCGFGRYRKAA